MNSPTVMYEVAGCGQALPFSDTAFGQIKSVESEGKLVTFPLKFQKPVGSQEKGKP